MTTPPRLSLEERIKEYEYDFWQEQPAYRKFGIECARSELEALRNLLLHEICEIQNQGEGPERAIVLTSVIKEIDEALK